MSANGALGGAIDISTMRAMLGIGEDVWISNGVVAKEGVEFDQDDLKCPLVSVTLQPSGVEVICRVLSSCAGNLEGEWHPFVEGDEVLVAIPAASPRAGCVILGKLNGGVDAFPKKVAGQDVDGNKFAFKRVRTPYLVETNGFLVRHATTTAFMSLDNGGGATLANGDGHYLGITSDFVTLSSIDNDFIIQMNLTSGFISLEAGPSSIFQLRKSGTSILSTADVLSISTSGASPFWHNAGTEHVLALVQGIFAAVGVALGATPLTGASLAAAVVTALSSGLAVPGASAFAMTPALTAALATALAVSPDPTGVKPGVGSAGLLFG